MPKYTDEQIKKIVECCSKMPQRCEECPLLIPGGCGTVNKYELIHDLINRQEAEIERLKEKNRLANQCTPKAIRRAKSEAIKEFAQRLKNELLKDLKGNDDLAYFMFGYIDNLVKEMVGEGE